MYRAEVAMAKAAMATSPALHRTRGICLSGALRCEHCIKLCEREAAYLVATGAEKHRTVLKPNENLWVITLRAEAPLLERRGVFC